MTGYALEIQRSAALLAELVADIDAHVQAGKVLGNGTPEDLVGARQLLVEQKRCLTDAVEALDSLIGDLMGEHRVTVMGVGTFIRHKRKSRTKWEKDALLSVVLDSRLVDPETGEVKDESPLDRVLDVWNLGAPRTTALTARGIDADEYATVETREGWSLEVVA